MFALITGAAGFIGSNLARRLLRDGWRVRGVDCFTPYYEQALKRDNLTPLGGHDGFEFLEADLRETDHSRLLDGVDVVFHQAAQPGVRMSWADGFRLYNELNVDVTQRLLEATRGASVTRFVFASSSSVYGNAPVYPTTETDRTAPFNPYGVTKLAAEMLCNAYAHNFGVPVTSLRYFTVYGPGQRPDMAIHRMIEAALSGAPFPVFGDGRQVRDFTAVGDVVEANVLAATASLDPGTVLNVAGGAATTLSDLIELVGRSVGTPVPVEKRPAQPGDVARTGASIDEIGRQLGWKPAIGLAEGVGAQVEWHRSTRSRRT